MKHNLLPLLVGSFTVSSVALGLPNLDESILVLVDDFVPQPLRCDDVWFYNRLGGDRGQVDGWWDPDCGCSHPGGGKAIFGNGQVEATITQDKGSEAWVGVWTSLNHVISEGLALDFGAIFPSAILNEFQGMVTELRVQVLDGQGLFQVDLQNQNDDTVWTHAPEILSGGSQLFQFKLPSLNDVRNLNWIVKGHIGDFVIVGKVELVVSLPELPTAERAFLWSYAMLLANWDAKSGQTRDRANFPAGDFDNVSANGLQAAAAVMAWKLGFIDKASAVEIVSSSTEALLDLQDCGGLWPHFITNGNITEGTEWSSLDTIITLVAFIAANEALGLEDGVAQLESTMLEIEWDNLILDDGSLSHGYDFDCRTRLPFGWADFGTETWLANLGYAAATGQIGVMDGTPPTFNGSGFIDELAWLLVPPPVCDQWSVQWPVYRQEALEEQLTYYSDDPCYGPLDLFGLSAAEVPDPSAVRCPDIYQAFGVGGEIRANDGIALLGHPVTTPHYPALASVLDPQASDVYWDWMTDRGVFTPLNNVDSFMLVDEPECNQIVWNSLRGSWNLGLQTLGWARYLVQDRNLANPLYEAVLQNTLLSDGYALLVSPADINCDGMVGVSDLLILLASWGQCNDCDACPADLNGDCTVGVADLLILLANWG